MPSSLVSGTLLNATQSNHLDFCSPTNGQVIQSTDTNAQGGYSVGLDYGKYKIKVNGGPATSPDPLNVWKPIQTANINGGAYTK